MDSETRHFSWLGYGPTALGWIVFTAPILVMMGRGRLITSSDEVTLAGAGLAAFLLNLFGMIGTIWANRAHRKGGSTTSLALGMGSLVLAIVGLSGGALMAFVGLVLMLIPNNG